MIQDWRIAEDQYIMHEDGVVHADGMCACMSRSICIESIVRSCGSLGRRCAV
jgi:hypothetical protein